MSEFSVRACDWKALQDPGRVIENSLQGHAHGHTQTAQEERELRKDWAWFPREFD